MKRKQIPLLVGRNVVLEALQAGRPIDKIFIQQNLGGESSREIRELAASQDVPVSKVPIQKLDRLSRANHQGVIGMSSPVAFQKLDDLIPFLYERGITPLILLLDGITDVRNFGAIARSAEVLGAQAIVIPVKNSAPVSSDAIKTSAGALLRIPVCRTNRWKEALKTLNMHGIKIYAADGNASRQINEVDLVQPSAIILGAEGKGLSKDSLRLADDLVRIPQAGETDSLNVSVACGVILYEASRQRNASPPEK